MPWVHAHAHGHAHAHVTCTCTCTCAYSIPRALWHVHEPICACPLRALIMCMCLATLCTVLEWMRAPLQFAWMMNIALLLTIIALLLWDILSYYGEIPFGSVLVSMVIADVLGLASASPPSNRSPVVPCRVLRPHLPCTPPCTTPCTPMHPGLHPLRTPSVTPCAKHPACSLHPAPSTLLPSCLPAGERALPPTPRQDRAARALRAERAEGEGN